MADGTFGSNENRRINTEPDNIREHREYRSGGSTFLSNSRYRVAVITPEHWVDIVFCSLFLIFGIIIACTWSSFMDGLFFNVLFPVICVGGKILAIVLIIVIVVGLISLRFRRRRYW